MGDKIVNLIDKFYEGSANAQEEKELRERLSQSKDTKYLPLQQYFALIDEEQNCTLPVDLDQKIADSFIEKKKNIWLLSLKIGIAASIACLMLAGIMWQSDRLKKSPQYSEAEIQQSYTQARSALITMSTYLNNGMQKMRLPAVMEKPFQDLHKLSEIKILEEHEDQ